MAPEPNNAIADKGGGEGHVAVLGTPALGDPDAAAVKVHVGEPDPDELGDPDPRVEQG
jgi:hypothetical protein